MEIISKILILYYFDLSLEISIVIALLLDIYVKMIVYSSYILNLDSAAIE
jgi:hypothetical protein